jgi:hypothetical protein
LFDELKYQRTHYILVFWNPVLVAGLEKPSGGVVNSRERQLILETKLTYQENPALLPNCILSRKIVASQMRSSEQNVCWAI